jgi:hypothetical protein
LAVAQAGTEVGLDGSAAAQGEAVVERVVAAPDEPAAAAVGQVEFRAAQAGLAVEWVCSPVVLVWFAVDRG